jgi:hypothetical protein
MPYIADDIVGHFRTIEEVLSRNALRTEKPQQERLTKLSFAERREELRWIVNKFKRENLDVVERCALLSDAVYYDELDKELIEKIPESFSRCYIPEKKLKAWVFKANGGRHRIVVVRGTVPSISNWRQNLMLLRGEISFTNAMRLIPVLPILMCTTLLVVSSFILATGLYYSSYSVSDFKKTFFILLWMIAVTYVFHLFWNELAFRFPSLVTRHHRYEVATREILKKCDSEAAEFILTVGHSLGGGISMVSASIAERCVSLGFNSAPGVAYSYALCGSAFNLTTKDDILTRGLGFAHAHLSAWIVDSDKRFPWAVWLGSMASTAAFTAGSIIALNLPNLGLKQYTSVCLLGSFGIGFAMQILFWGRSLLVSIRAHGMRSVLEDVEKFRAYEREREKVRDAFLAEHWDLDSAG